MESAARTRWLVEGGNEWEREARWLALMDEGVRTHTRVKGVLSDPDSAEGLADFVRDVKAKLPSGTNIPRIPPVADMLRGSGEQLGVLYTLASQYTHATDHAVLMYRRGLGGEASYGEDRSERHWNLPLWTAWRAVESAIVSLMTASGVPPGLDLPNLEGAIEEAFKAFEARLETEESEDGPWWPSDREWNEREID